MADHTVGAARPVLAVTATSREAEDLVEALRCLLPPETVAEYPSWETLPHERLSPRSDTVGRRLAVLRRLVHPEDHSDEGAGPLQVVVAPVRSVLQPQVAGLAELKPVRVHAGDELAIDDLVDQLAAAAYTRVDLVERRGEFAVRGGIVDVFPPTEEHPPGWTSGATPSRTSSGSRSPTSAPWSRPNTACGRHHAASCC